MTMNAVTAAAQKKVATADHKGCSRHELHVSGAYLSKNPKWDQQTKQHQCCGYPETDAPDICATKPVRRHYRNAKAYDDKDIVVSNLLLAEIQKTDLAENRDQHEL